MNATQVVTPAGTITARETSELTNLEQIFAEWLKRAGINIDERVHEKLHAKVRALLFIPPNGYIGFRTQRAQRRVLSEYLRRFLFRKNWIKVRFHAAMLIYASIGS